ncbi:MAG: hypothetical protein WA252_09895, partial [Candidatus Sulfotelmatobacter sp.]
MIKHMMIAAVITTAALAMGQTATTKKVASASAPARVSGPGVKDDDGLQYWDIRVGNGATAKEGSHVR